MRGSTVDQVRHDVSEQIDEAERAAGLQSMFPPEPDEPESGALWFAVGAGLSAAAIAVAAAIA